MTFSDLWHNFFGFYGQFPIKISPSPLITRKRPPDETFVTLFTRLAWVNSSVKRNKQI